MYKIGKEHENNSLIDIYKLINPTFVMNLLKDFVTEANKKRGQVCLNLRKRKMNQEGITKEDILNTIVKSQKKSNKQLMKNITQK